jgi:hypothetical protein
MNPFTSEISNPPINTQNQADIGVVLRQTSRALPEVRFLKAKKISRRYQVHADSGLCMLWSHRGRMPWHTKKYFDNERADLRANQFLRLHRNQWVSAESQFIGADEWDAIVDPSLSPALNSASVFLGVDLGVKSDSSAVVALGRDATGKKLVAAFHCMASDEGGASDARRGEELHCPGAPPPSRARRLC